MAAVKKRENNQRSYAEEMQRVVVKENDLIRRCSHDLTLTQEKLICYVISMIDQGDEEFQTYEISEKKFRALCGTSSRGFYKHFKESMLSLDRKSFILETPEKLTVIRWFSEFFYFPKQGKIRVLLNSEMKRQLLGLMGNYTKYELYNIIALKSKHSLRFFEIFKSYEYQQEIIFSVEDIKKLLNVQGKGYANFANLRTKVIDKAVEEINGTTSLNVSYRLKKKVNQVTHVVFHIEEKPEEEKKAVLGSVLQMIEEDLDKAM